MIRAIALASLLALAGCQSMGGVLKSAADKAMVLASDAETQKALIEFACSNLTNAVDEKVFTCAAAASKYEELSSTITLLIDELKKPSPDATSVIILVSTAVKQNAELVKILNHLKDYS